MRKHALFALCFLPLLLSAQEYRRVDVYQYYGKDSTQATLARRCFFLPNGKLSIDSCFNFKVSADAAYDGITVYEYRDTFLLKRTWAGREGDTIVAEYRYNEKHQLRWMMVMKKTKKHMGNPEPAWYPLSTTEMEYDSAGRIAATHFKGPHTQFSGNTWTYDDSGRVLVQCGYNISTIVTKDEHSYSGNKHFIVHRLYNLDGTSRTEDTAVFSYSPLRTTTITSDRWGREIESVITADGKQCERIVTEYDAYGRVARKVFYKEADHSMIKQYYKYFR